MNRTFQKQWAREEILDWIDEGITELENKIDGISVDEWVIFRKERNRVAKLFRMKGETK